MKKSFLLPLLIFSLISNAQQFGGNPPSLKWNQLNTDTARIIFPAGMDTAAKRIANIVHYLASQKPISLGDQIRKINIVLQNQTTVPNGYVGLGPFRSEFFLTPDPDNLGEGSIPWGDQLALHEYRHVQQFNNFNHGLSRLMKILSGEDGYSLAINTAIPDWFYEGDAVYNETILSQQGRGRVPRFLNAYPSLWQAGKKFSWMKMRNGSLKDYVPNHYYLGYLLVSYGREKYGADFWTKVTRDASAYKGLFYPFQTAIKKYTGQNYETFRNEALDHYKSSVEKVTINDADFLIPVSRNYVTSYYYPYYAGTDSLIYLKTSYRHRPAFYLRDKDGEHLIRIKDISIDEKFSYRNGQIVYAAYESDARWNWKDYSVIRILDTRTKVQRTLTNGSKYFSPDISPDGTKIVAVKNSPDGKSVLDIINSADGTFLTSIQSHEIIQYTDPIFIDDNSVVTAVRLKDGKMALATAEISSGVTIRLTTPSFNVIGYPCVKGDTVYFTASYLGNDNIFFVKLSDQKVYHAFSWPQGSYFVNVSNGKMTWSAFTAEGYQLRQKNLSDLDIFELKPADINTLTTKLPSTLPKDGREILQDIQERNFKVSKYSKGKGLFNFHSWRPYYSDPVFTYSLYGENILNTLQSEIYYSYNRNEKTNAVGISELYGASYPYLNFGAEYTFDREDIIGNKVRQWGQLDSRVGLLLPFRFTNGRTFKNLSLGTYYVLRNEFNKGFYKDSLGSSSFSYLLHSLSWAQQIQRAVQQFYPRFGYGLNANHRYSISSQTGYQFISNAFLYLPGLFSTHNILLAGSFQQRDTFNNVSFSNRFLYSRGYTGRYFSRMWRLSANYHFPLLYPDWGFGNILYLQAVRINGFCDFTKVFSRNKKETRDQRSVGGELFLDTKWWNQYPLTFGFRISYLPDPDQYNGFKGTIFEFILPVSIIPR